MEGGKRNKDRQIRICLWNIAGVTNKDEDTWRYLEGFDIVGLVETWMEKEKWRKIEDKMNKKFIWKSVAADREEKRGRARGGMLIAIRKEMEGIKVREISKRTVEIELTRTRERWRIYVIYSQKIEETLEELKREIKEEEEGHLLIGGDFNARTGNEGGPIYGMEKEKETRKSKDKIVNREGKILIETMRERGWMIMNGKGEEEGGWTYIGERGTSVIDYVVANEKAAQEIKTVREGLRTESDHVPLEVVIEGEKKERKVEEGEIEIERSVWTEEGIEEYHKRCEGWICNRTETEEIWKELEEKVKEARKRERKKIKPWKMGRKEWHSKEWKEKKREVRREMEKWRKGKIDKKEYVRKRREYKRWCEEERKKHREEEEEKIKAIRTEEEAWKYINKYRKRREKIDDNIEMEKWTEHFMELLEGSKIKRKEEKEIREVKELVEREEEGKEKEDEITDEEIISQLRELKKRKAPGENGIENEAWRLMPKEIGEVMARLIKKIWKEGGIPGDWNRGVISPIFKKGKKEEVRNYRGVTLMDTAYKIYANILNKRLKQEVGGKLGEGQVGFREGRGTMDAVYVLNYVANRELAKKGGKVFVFFADLKAAFDKVDRRKMKEMLQKAEVGERLRNRIMETYEETRSIVRVGNRKSEEFWTSSGVRQGCPLSPLLFNIYIMDLEEEMRKEQTGGVVVGREKFWTITYADDIVLIAKSEEEMKGMIKRFKRYLERKCLKLSPEKSKMLVFENGKGRGKRREWYWGGEEIEEVKEISYLGYVMQKNGGSEKHIEERMRRAMIAMKHTWSIGERLFKEDFERRMKMFGALVRSIALYGAEIWGWKKEEKIERIKRKYIKWVLGLDYRTPNYILTEETKERELGVEALKRAIRYEEKARESDKKIVIECIKEAERERRKKEESKWEKKRRERLERSGISKEERERMREEKGGEEVGRELIERIERREKEERWKKINESKSNEIYKEIFTEERPRYLKGRRKKKERNIIARFRCGNEARIGRYWESEEGRRCRICGEKEEDWMHILRECEETREEVEIRELMEENGRGYEIMKRINKKREEREGKKEEKEEEGEGKKQNVK